MKAHFGYAKAKVGIGGVFCSCCNPLIGKTRGEGSKANRVRGNRAIRRKAKVANLFDAYDAYKASIIDLEDLVYDGTLILWGKDSYKTEQLIYTDPFGYDTNDIMDDYHPFFGDLPSLRIQEERIMEDENRILGQSYNRTWGID